MLPPGWPGSYWPRFKKRPWKMDLGPHLPGPWPRGRVILMRRFHQAAVIETLALWRKLSSTIRPDFPRYSKPLSGVQSGRLCGAGPSLLPAAHGSLRQISDSGDGRRCPPLMRGERGGCCGAALRQGKR